MQEAEGKEPAGEMEKGMVEKGDERDGEVMEKGMWGRETYPAVIWSGVSRCISEFCL